MPKKVEPLEAIKVKRLTKPGYHAVGGVSGLLLRVSKTGARSWILRTMIGGRRRDIGLGGYPDVSLARAREKAATAKDDISEGKDPVEERRKAKAALKAEQQTRKTFAEVWPEFFEAKRADWGKKNQQHWKNSIERYALPVIGSMVVADIEMRHIKDVIEPIWTEKTMMAKKLRGRLEAVLSYATVHGYRQGDNPARWKDNLKEVLPSPSKVHKVQHFRTLKYDDCPEFIAALRKREGTAARALEFTILTACRSGEVRGARWGEIDFKRKSWCIPAERMKMETEHVVPLSDAALAVLEQMPKDSELIFPAPRGGPLSDMSLLAVIKRMDYKEQTTAHGFRSSFANWAINETDEPDFVSEECLAHDIGDGVRRSYKERTRKAKRLKLMREWSQFLGYEEQGAKVANIA